MTVNNIDHKEALRGKEAQAVLDNEAFKAAMGCLKSSVQEQGKPAPFVTVKAKCCYCSLQN